MLIDCQGLVLKHIKTGGDSLLRIFTKEFGKITVSVSQQELASSKRAKLPIKPFTVSNYSLYKGRSGYKYSSADVIRSFYGIGSDFQKFAYGSLALELVEAILDEGQNDDRIYSLIVEFLKSLENPMVDGGTLLIAFEIKLLKLLGLRPMTGACSMCHEAVDGRLFSIEDGGVICNDCAREKKIKASQFSFTPLIYDCKFDIMSTIDYFDRKPFKDFEKIKLKPQVAKTMMEIVEKYLNSHLQIGSLKSSKLLDDI